MSNNFFSYIKNINIYSLGKDLLRGLWIVVIVGCIGIMLTYTGIRKSYVPQYSSSGIYVVTPKQSTGYVYTNKRFAESVIDVFQNLMNADIMKNRVAQELHMQKLDAVMNVELIKETNLMKITCTANDPVVAFQCIGAIMDNYNSLSEYLNSDAVFDVLRAPVVPGRPNNVLMPRNQSLKMGGVYSFVALLILAAISLFRKTIKTTDAVEEQLGANLLGTIYHENKNRTIHAKIVQTVKALLITSPIISTRFVDGINNVRIKMEYEHDRHPRRKVFLFTSACENEGKSTVSVNVALSLAREGKKVIIIDADMRKPAMFKLLNIPKSEINDMIFLLQGACGLDEVLYDIEKLKIKVIMSKNGHSNTHEFIKSGAMTDLIDKCRELADYVIVDTPPMALVSDAEALLDRTDYATLIIRQDFSYLNEIKGCIDLINDSKAKMLGCVLNDYRVVGVAKKKLNFYKNQDGKAVEIYDN